MIKNALRLSIICIFRKHRSSKFQCSTIISLRIKFWKGNSNTSVPLINYYFHKILYRIINVPNYYISYSIYISYRDTSLVITLFPIIIQFEQFIFHQTTLDWFISYCWELIANNPFPMNRLFQAIRFPSNIN